MDDNRVSRERGRRRILERGPGLRKGLEDLPENLNAFTVSTGVIPAAVIFITFAALQVDSLSAVGFSESQIVAWVSVSYGLGGLIALIMSLYYKMPIAGAWAIPGFILVASALENVSAAEAFGGFWLAGVIVLVLGVTGAMRRVVGLLPVPVMMGMIAGVLLQYPIGIVDSLQDSAIIAGAGLVGYLLFDRLQGVFRRVPGILGTALFGGAAAAAVGQLSFSGIEFGLGQIEFTAPSFSLVSLFSIAIPLAILVVGAENMQATGILAAEKYRPPVNSMTVISGVGGLLAALLGAHNANVAGPTTAVMASPDAGPTGGRYVASALSGVVYILLALIAGTVVAVLGAIPATLTAILLGMVLIKPVINAIQQAWMPGNFATGAFFAFFIAVSGITFLGISAPFWALVGGAIASIVFEFDDYRNLVRGGAGAMDEPVASDGHATDDPDVKPEVSLEDRETFRS